MKKLVIILVCFTPLLALSQKKTAFVADLEGMIDRNAGQLAQLAEAFPESKYDWSPEKGVRSVGKALLHVASANYFFGNTLGFGIPDGVDPMKLESSVNGKKNIIETVNKSFDHIKSNIGSLKKKDLKAKVETPFGTFSKRQMLLILYEHSGEHKGQLIAYARSNGITPPWSQN